MNAPNSRIERRRDYATRATLQSLLDALRGSSRVARETVREEIRHATKRIEDWTEIAKGGEYR